MQGDEHRIISMETMSPQTSKPMLAESNLVPAQCILYHIIIMARLE